ncbi:NUDIX domain-containing protein [Roseicyclus persicicus]|uniref:ADP-ribose pyrophosphatase n=1 Tax=Roseicyclus persicicus TaxID=2650661 RepID=A0A7X6K007_9RHOB|nr:gamma-glutamylcyclotransferase [Roseibacterium persicicum]NKX46139.1 NUDIX domain-containing protein [Roseibacterium persicicum]
MTEIFLFGTLCHGPLLRAVAGADLAVRPAAMPGARVAKVAGAAWPMLEDAPGARAEGVLIEASGEALARLDFYEAVFGYTRQPVTVEMRGAARVVDAWRPHGAPGAPDGPWSLDAWARDWAALTILAAQEVMRQRAEGATADDIARRYWMICARAQAEVSAGAWARPGLVGRTPHRDTVEVVARRHPYSRFFTVEELAVRHPQFDGTQSPVQERAVFRVADAVTVLPYDPVRDRILLIEQIRLGAYAHGDAHPWLLEPVAGMIDAGEAPETAARRETVEEAGLDLGDLHFVARYYPSPGGIAQVLTSYVGIADLPDDAAGIGGHDHEGEDILSHLVDWPLALEMLKRGDMANAPLVVSMQWLMLNRDRLRPSA